MAIEAEAFTQRNLTNVEVVQYQMGATDIEDLQEWLNGGPTGDYTAELFGWQNLLQIKKNAVDVLTLGNWEYVVRTADGGLFKVDKDLLSVIWTPSV